MKASWPMLSLLALAGCRQEPSGTKLPNGPETITVASTAFKEGGTIPAKYGAANGNVSPPLSWTGAPAQTKSFALIVQDPDAPTQSPYIHWLLADIPPGTTSFGEGTVPFHAVLGKNGSGEIGYFGPEPPTGTHHYQFCLFALDKPLGMAPGYSVKELAMKMKNHILAQGKLTGLYTH